MHSSESTNNPCGQKDWESVWDEQIVAELAALKAGQSAQRLELMWGPDWERMLATTWGAKWDATWDVKWDVTWELQWGVMWDKWSAQASATGSDMCSKLATAAA
jgi:hypothetical protein